MDLERIVYTICSEDAIGKWSGQKSRSAARLHIWRIGCSFPIEPGRWKPPSELSLQGVSAASSHQTKA